MVAGSNTDSMGRFMSQTPDTEELEAQIALLIKQAGKSPQGTSADPGRASPPLQPLPDASQPTREDGR
jgi:hypothetical protein